MQVKEFQAVALAGFSLGVFLWNSLNTSLKNTQNELHARKGSAKSRLIKTETPDVINFSNTCNFVVSSKQQLGLLMRRLGAKWPGLFLSRTFHKPAAILTVPCGPGCSYS